MRATLCWWDICESIILEDPVDGSSGFECTALPATSTESNDISISTRRMHPRKRNIGFLLNLLRCVFLVEILAFILASTSHHPDHNHEWPLKLVALESCEPLWKLRHFWQQQMQQLQGPKYKAGHGTTLKFGTISFFQQRYISEQCVVFNLRLRWNCVLSTHFFASMRSQSQIWPWEALD